MSKLDRIRQEKRSSKIQVICSAGILACGSMFLNLDKLNSPEDNISKENYTECIINNNEQSCDKIKSDKDFITGKRLYNANENQDTLGKIVLVSGSGVSLISLFGMYSSRKREKEELEKKTTKKVLKKLSI